jgi:hypothetical protein
MSAAYEGPRGIPHVPDALTRLGQTGRGAAKENRARSVSGPVIWSAAPAYGALDSPQPHDADADGFAVFGRYPVGFLRHIRTAQWLGRVRPEEILHVCSGTLGPEQAWTVDIRAEARPRVIATGTALPFRSESFRAVMIDPPYSDQYARNLYGIAMPRNAALLKEAARVLVPGGRVGLLHVAVPFAPPGCAVVNVWGVSTGVGFRIRAFTVYEKRHAEFAF